MAANICACCSRQTTRTCGIFGFGCRAIASVRTRCGRISLLWSRCDRFWKPTFGPLKKEEQVDFWSTGTNWPQPTASVSWS